MRLLIAVIAAAAIALFILDMADEAFAAKPIPACTITPPNPLVGDAFTVTYTVAPGQHPSRVRPAVYIYDPFAIDRYGYPPELASSYDGVTVTAAGTVPPRYYNYTGAFLILILDEANGNQALAECEIPAIS